MSARSVTREHKHIYHGWKTVAIFFVMGLSTYGIRQCFGVFFKSIESDFNLTRAATSTVFSVSMALGCIFAFLGGWALDRWGSKAVVLLLGLFTGLSLVMTSRANQFWQLYFTYGLFLSAGTSANYVVTVSTVSKWFDKKRGLALGIAGAGTGIGTAFLAPLAAYLISKFDWRTACLALGLLAWSIGIPASRLLAKDPRVDEPSRNMKEQGPSHGANNNSRPGSLSLQQALRTRSFWLILGVWFFGAINANLVTAHVVPHATDLNIPATSAATVLGLIGLSFVAGRVLLGLISEKVGKRTAGITCTLVQTCCMLWLLAADQLWMFYLFAIMYGVSWGGVGNVLATLAGETFGLGRIGAILGAQEIGFGIGAALGPAIGGLLFDISGNYTVAFVMGASVMFIVYLLIAPIRQEVGKVNA